MLLSFSKWAYFQRAFPAHNQRDYKAHKTQKHRPQVNKYRDPLATGKALPRYHAVLLGSEAYLAQLRRLDVCRTSEGGLGTFVYPKYHN